MRQVLILLRKDGLDHALHAARTLRGLGMRVLVSWKESGLPQVARVLAQPRLYQRFRTICGEADGFISSTMDLLPLYEAAGCSGRFIPTPYPTEESAWDFSIPIRQRRGVFIGTREFGIPSRNHLLAVSCASRFGHPVTVVNTEGWTGSRLLRSISDEMRIIPGSSPTRHISVSWRNIGSFSSSIAARYRARWPEMPCSAASRASEGTERWTGLSFQISAGRIGRLGRPSRWPDVSSRMMAFTRRCLKKPARLPWSAFAFPR